MTFISTIIAKEGIVLTADSKELIRGAHILWDDFDDLLQAKNSNEDDETPCISPKEIKDKFIAKANATEGRVKSTDGAKKIFSVGTHSAILISGLANLNGKEFNEIIQEIENKIASSGDKSFGNILTVTHNILGAFLRADSSQDKEESEYLFCGLDEHDSKFKVFKFFFTDKRFPDGNGGFERNTDGSFKTEKYFAFAERTALLNTSGYTKYIGELGSINQLNYEIGLPQAFELSKRIMDLVVSIENVTNKITGIGGKIYFAVITKDGFRWVNSESEVMNLLERN